MTVKLERPRKPDRRIPIIAGNGLMNDVWDMYFQRLEEYVAALEARIVALEP